MKGIVTTLSLLVLILLAGIAFATTAPLRSPQVTFDSVPLQTYFTSLGVTHNVATDQADAQVWSTDLIRSSVFSIGILKGVNNEIGIYNGADPEPILYPILPSTAPIGWFAEVLLHSDGRAVVLLHDDEANYLGRTLYTGVNSSAFGFYVKSANGTFYSQDVRQDRPMVLTYACAVGGAYYWDCYSWWLCFQNSACPLASSTFDSVVLWISTPEPLFPPLSTQKSTWGKLKTLYR